MPVAMFDVDVRAQPLKEPLLLLTLQKSKNLSWNLVHSTPENLLRLKDVHSGQADICAISSGELLADLGTEFKNLNEICQENSPSTMEPQARRL